MSGIAIHIVRHTWLCRVRSLVMRRNRAAHLTLVSGCPGLDTPFLRDRWNPSAAHREDRVIVGSINDDVPVDVLEKSRDDLIRKISEELSEDERTFILSVKEAKPVWELLGLEGVENLPAIKWKLMNLSRMDSGKHKAAVKKLRDYLGV